MVDAMKKWLLSSKANTNYANLFAYAFIGFLVANLLIGRRGLISMIKLRNQIECASHELELVRAHRIEIENQVTLLSASSLDLDMLDEKARKILDLAGPNEVVLILNKAD